MNKESSEGLKAGRDEAHSRLLVLMFKEEEHVDAAPGPTTGGVEHASVDKKDTQRPCGALIVLQYVHLPCIVLYSSRTVVLGHSTCTMERERT